MAFECLVGSRLSPPGEMTACSSLKILGVGPMFTEMMITVICLGQSLQTPTPSNAISESLDVRCARAQLQLAEANLNRVQQSNKRVAGSVPNSVVAEYQDEVKIAKRRLDQASAVGAASEFQVWLQRAEAEQRTAETTWKIATAVNGRLPGTFDVLDVERYRLRAEVAKLQLERGQALVDSGLEAKLQWKIDMLDSQVQRLKEESRQPASYLPIYPFWGW
jgi:hypothetical protein